MHGGCRLNSTFMQGNKFRDNYMRWGSHVWLFVGLPWWGRKGKIKKHSSLNRRKCVWGVREVTSSAILPPCCSVDNRHLICLFTSFFTSLFPAAQGSPRSVLSAQVGSCRGRGLLNPLLPDPFNWRSQRSNLWLSSGQAESQCGVVVKTGGL